MPPRSASPVAGAPEEAAEYARCGTAGQIVKDLRVVKGL
jgi:hypothetical protein